MSMRATRRSAACAASLCVAFLVIAALDGTAAAKKKGKGKRKVAAVEPLKCGVCVAAVEQITDEVGDSR